MKKIKITLIAFASLCLMLLVIKSCIGEKKELTIDTVKAVKGNVSNTVTATGTIEAIKTVQVGTQVSGIISKIYADFNSVVKKGQVLAELDKAPLMSAFQSAQASIDDASAEYGYQKSNFERIKVLYDKKLVAQSDYELALYNFQKAEASLKVAQSNFSKAKINLDYATITSPINGVVLDRAVDEGQTVAASFNTPTLFTIANDLTQMEVQANIDEADIGQVRNNQKVIFTVDAYPDLTFDGEVTEIRLQPITTSNVVTYTVIVRAPNPDKKLMPGMTASITIITAEANDVITVPSRTLLFKPDPELLAKYYESLPAKERPQEKNWKNEKHDSVTGALVQAKHKKHSGNKVWVKEGTNIHPVRVEVGIDDGINVEIKTGLKEGEDVITDILSGKKAATTASAASKTRSPFMPTPPSRRRN